MVYEESKKDSIFFGLFISLTILTLVFSSLIYLIFYNFSSSSLDLIITLKIIRFTLFQSLLSVFLSCVVGFFVAKSLVNTRQLSNFNYYYISICSLAFVLPTVVAGLSIIKFWGNDGIIGFLNSQFDLPRNFLRFYGLFGILVAHIFFNAPLFVRVIYNTLINIPENYIKNSFQLNIKNINYFVLVEYPFLKKVLPSICGLVFLLCFTSFSLVLMFGGGPAASTLEVAIYTVIRSDFDLSSAAQLSFIQIILCFFFVSALSFFGFNNQNFSLEVESKKNSFRPKKSLVFLDIFIIILFSIYLFVPLILIVFNGFNNFIFNILFKTNVIQVILNSAILSISSVIITLLISWTIATARSELSVRKKTIKNKLFLDVLDLFSLIFLLVPTIVLGVSIFVFFRNIIDYEYLVPLVLLFSNVLLSLPFATKIIFSKMIFLKIKHDKICKNLGISGIKRFLLIDFPCLRKEIAFASSITACLSLGDLGVIALFGNNDFQTLPWLIFSFMSSYRMDEAATLSLFLLILCLIFFFGFNKILGGKNVRNQTY